MKILTIILVVLGSFNLFSMEARISRLKKKKAYKTNINPTASKRRKNNAFKQLIENNKKLNALLKARTSVPVIWEGRKRVLTGKTYRGTLLNSIVSTNVASPVLVKAHGGQGLPFNSKFSCNAVTENKRIYCVCNKLITTDKEVQISAQLLNTDGSSGLEGFYDDAKEDLIAGAIISDFTAGVLSAAQTRIATPIGSMRDSTTKNQILQGGINSAGRVSEILLDEMNNKVPVVTIDAGSEVLIYFMEAANVY
ncbi:MAG: TrbI/VirB10 family protein [Bacteriovoracaceae bacterium]|jgi:hypothetical protein|nr:TrbI/VirB10 family protein [Bacteriovoracaceae bacterium]